MDDILVLPREGLERLFGALRDRGYRILGPRAGADVIGFAELASSADLPWGLADEQAPGSYRLQSAPPSRAFYWTTMPQAARSLCFPAEEPLWRVDRSDGGGLRFEPVEPDAGPTAVIGFRACDLAALALHDRHFARDPWYGRRRAALLVIAVNCARSAATCFCASTGDGPAVSGGQDLLLDELDDGYLVRAGSEAGRELLEGLALQSADDGRIREAAAQTEAAAAAQTRRIPGGDLENALLRNGESPVWETIAERCLACGNCTSVCPSCFCHRHTESPSLDASISIHGREWDSCFSEGHSLLHGRSHRPGVAQRYRQWLSHKFGTWHGQYGRSGCTGCGRCITWCPVGIDVTRSLAAVLEGAQE